MYEFIRSFFETDFQFGVFIGFWIPFLFSIFILILVEIVDFISNYSDFKEWKNKKGSD